MAMVLLINVTTALIDKNANATLSNTLLIFEGLIFVLTPRYPAHVMLNFLLMLRNVLQHIIALLEDLLFDHILIENLVVEGQRFLID